MTIQDRVAFSPAEVGELLGLSPSTVYRGLEDGSIPSRRLGRRRLVPAEWVREHSVTPAADRTRNARTAHVGSGGRSATDNQLPEEN